MSKEKVTVVFGNGETPTVHRTRRQGCDKLRERVGSLSPNEKGKVGKFLEGREQKSYVGGVTVTEVEIQD